MTPPTPGPGRGGHLNQFRSPALQKYLERYRREEELRRVDRAVEHYTEQLREARRARSSR